MRKWRRPESGLRRTQPREVYSVAWDFSFPPPLVCLPREQETSNSDQMKAGKTQLSGSKDKASSLQYHSLNPDIRGEGRREVAGSSRMVFWGRGRDYANRHAIVLGKVFPYREAQPHNSATASTFCVVSAELTPALDLFICTGPA